MHISPHYEQSLARSIQRDYEREAERFRLMKKHERPSTLRPLVQAATVVGGLMLLLNSQ